MLGNNGAPLALVLSLALSLAAVGCRGAKKDAAGPGTPNAGVSSAPNTAPSAARPADTKATLAEAEAFVRETEAELLKLFVARNRATWLQATYIVHDSEILAAAAEEAVMEFMSKRSAQATRFDSLPLSPELRRKLSLLKLRQDLPAPANAQRRAELATIAKRMEGEYGKGKYCSPRHKGKCLSLGALSDILAKSRDYDEQLDAWTGWRTISPPIRKDFTRYVELANEGARSLGFANMGDLWKSRYDMTPAAFEAEGDRLWQQVRPLYEQLHCYTRAKLAAKYGESKVPPQGPIPAHLLGNMWGQEWQNLVDLLAPEKGGTVDLAKALAARKTDEIGMVKLGEAFFTSLGMDPLPKTFWERSLFKKPADREVVCHASAWDVDEDADLRIKMCIKVNDEDFTTIHHELGHNYYQYYYRKKSILFRESANDGFHEGLGDTIGLSVTPEYLVKIGLLQKAPAAGLGELMQRALGKVAFLPFALLVDRWRWDVLAGKIAPADYNKSWWALVRRYQGIAPAAERGEEHFDPGAKYHVPANVPYTRYFLAAILQYQFHRALCRVAGHQGPLSTCSIYGNKEAGARLVKMMEMGLEKPWPEALHALTGERTMDASAIIDYYKPLMDWLVAQNQGRRCGW
jgi:peptidyl-dipeptidase A